MFTLRRINLKSAGPGVLRELQSVDEAIAQYNKSLNEIDASKPFFDSAQSPNRLDLLKAILSSIEDYFAMAPKSLRIKDSSETWESKLAQYPEAMNLIQLQKLLVPLLFMPVDVPYVDWKSEIAKKKTSSEGTYGPSIVLSDKYHDEIDLDGNQFLGKWIHSTSLTDYPFPQGKEFLLTHQEVMKIIQEQPVRNSNEVVIQVSDPDDYLLEYNADDNCFYFFFLDDFDLKTSLFKKEKMDTREARSEHPSNEDHLGQVIYVATTDGHIYTNNPKVLEKESFHHSSFLNGSPVLCAGTLAFEEGKLKLVSNGSGHYLPSKEALWRFVHMLKEKYGIELSEVRVDYHRLVDEEIKVTRFRADHFHADMNITEAFIEPGQKEYEKAMAICQEELNAVFDNDHFITHLEKACRLEYEPAKKIKHCLEILKDRLDIVKHTNSLDEIKALGPSFCKLDEAMAKPSRGFEDHNLDMFVDRCQGYLGFTMTRRRGLLKNAFLKAKPAEKNKDESMVPDKDKKPTI